MPARSRSVKTARMIDTGDVGDVDDSDARRSRGRAGGSSASRTTTVSMTRRSPSTTRSPPVPARRSRCRSPRTTGTPTARRSPSRWSGRPATATSRSRMPRRWSTHRTPATSAAINSTTRSSTATAPRTAPGWSSNCSRARRTRHRWALRMTPRPAPRSPVVVEVLLNDVDPERDGLRIGSFTPPDNTTVGEVTETLGDSGLPALQFVPAAGFEGTAIVHVPAGRHARRPG